MSTALLEIGGLHVSYGRVEAVHGVSVALLPRQIVSVIGPNGAGKTTLLAAAMGLLPSLGTLRFEGEDLHGLDVEARVERGLCLVPERRELFGELSVQDNLQLGAYAGRLRRDALRRRLDSVYQRFPRLAERRAQRASTLSGGERQMLTLGRALMSAPRILLIDEPSVGLAPVLVRRTIDKIKELKDGFQLTVLMAEQNFTQAIRIADRGYVIVHGRIAFEGASAEALNNNELSRKFYLGM